MRQFVFPLQMVFALSMASPLRLQSLTNSRWPLALRVRHWVWDALSSSTPPLKTTSLKSSGAETVSNTETNTKNPQSGFNLFSVFHFCLTLVAVPLKPSKWVHTHWSGERATLTLVHLNKEDEGLYTLRVNTKSGFDSYSAYVFVRGEAWRGVQ